MGVPASGGQALRYGRWKLWTAANQTEIVIFCYWIERLLLCSPGDVVNVFRTHDKSGISLHGGRSSGSTVEAGLSVSASYAAGAIPGSASGFTNAHRAQNVVMAGEVILPTTFSEDQCLMEYGGTGVGMYVGIRDIGGVDNFVFRAGDGTDTQTTTECVLGEIPVSQIPEFDGRAHTVAWEMQPATGQARLWIDGKNYFDLVTTDGSNLDGSTWAGSNLGGWGSGQGTTAGGYALTAWSGSIISALRVYTNQIVPLSKTTIPLDSPVALLATSSYDLSVMFIDEAATLAQDSATIDSVNYVRGDLIPQAFIDSNGDGTYTLQDISTKAFSTNAKAAANSTDALLLDFSENHRVETRTVSTSAGTDISQLSVGTAFSSLPSKSHIWVLKETANSGAVTDAAALPYKILSIVEEDDSSYGLIGVRHYDEKFSAIEGVFTTYVEDTIAPRLLPTDTVPTVQSVTVTELANPSIRGNEFILEWEAPASQGTLSDIEESNIDQSALEGGALTTYEHLEAYEITHNIEEIESPILVPKTDTYYKFEGIENGFYTFGVKAVSVIGSKSKVKQTVAHLEDVYGQNVKRVALGMATGGTSDTSMFTDAAGLFQFEKSSYKVKSDGNGRLQENTSTTATAWSQDCSDMPALSYTPSTSNVFESDLFYIMLDYSDATDKVKLVKLHREAYGEDYWYDAGTGNATNRFSAQKTGSISKAANSNLIKGSGTAFTTEFKIGDILAAGTGNSPTVLGRITHIRDNTTLYLNKDGNYTISASHIRASNLDVDFINDVVVGSIYKTGSSFIFNAYTSLATATPTLVESDDSALAYYWPSNSVNGDYITETVAGAHGEVVGTAPTVSTQSPVGNSLVNDDGMLLLSDTQADALESGGFSASYWFKSTSSGGNAFARLLTRDHNNNWAMGVKQNEAADDVQNLIIWVNGPSGATLGDAITLNKWHHAGIVYDGTNFKVFLDGEEVYNKTGYAPITANPRPIAFGVNVEEAPASLHQFIGQFTEIKFFNDPISNAQMRNLYRLPGSTVAGTSDTPIQLGGENGSVLKVASEGLSLGNTTFASAPFRVDMAGNLNATSATITGAITATSGSIADSVTIGGGTAGDIVTGSDIIGAGSVNLNPNMTLVAPDGRPQGVLSAFGSASIGNISYQDAAKTVLKLHTATGSDTTTGAVWPAFRINPDAKYKVLVRWKATAASSNGAYLRIEEIDTELPIGKTHISHNSASSEAAVVEDTREINLWNNNSIATSYVDQIFDYTPTATAKWASALALNWAAMGTAEMHIDLLYIVEDTSVKSQGSVGGWTIDSDAIFSGTKKETDDFSASAGDITISSTGAIRANKFLLKADGNASFKGDISAATGTLSNSIQIGSGESVFKADSNGIYLGNETFANAEFSVTPAGALKATSAEVTGELKVGSFAGGQPVLDTVENTAVARGAMTSPRISMRGGNVYYGTLEDGTTIYKNDEVVQLNKTKGTRDNFSTAIGDIIHSNKPVVLHAAQGSLPSLAQTGTDFATMTGSGTNQNYFYYSPYGDTTVRLLKNTSANPTKSAGGTLIDWSDHNEFDKVHAATALGAGTTIVTAGSFVVGKSYIIATAGTTNFVLIGAADSNIGTTFTATGVGTGSGTALEVGYRYEIVTPGNTDFTAIGAADSNAGTQFNSTGAGTGTGTAKIVEGWVSKAVPATTVTEHTVVTSNNTATYTWIKADAPIVIYRNSGGNDHTIVRPAAREIFTYDGYLENKFNPSDTTTSQTRQSETDWRYIRNATAKLGSFDNGDGSGGDGTSHFPWSFAGDTYCLPHTLSGYQIATIESAIINAYYWSGSAWTLYKSHDLSEASRENFLGLKEGFDSVGGTDLGTSTVWRFVGTGRFVLRTNSTSPLATNDEYYALGYDSNLRAENTLRVGKIIAGDIAADAITADAIDAGAITADAIAADSIAVNKLTGDVAEEFPLEIFTDQALNTSILAATPLASFSIPAPSGGVAKKPKLTLEVSFKVETTSAAQNVFTDFILKRKSKGAVTTATGVLTLGAAAIDGSVVGTLIEELKIAGNVLGSMSSGRISDTHDASTNSYSIYTMYYSAADNATYIRIKQPAFTSGNIFDAGDNIFFSPDSFAATGTEIAITSPIQTGINVYVETGAQSSALRTYALQAVLGKTTTATEFILSAQNGAAYGSGVTAKVTTISGSMEHIV